MNQKLQHVKGNTNMAAPTADTLPSPAIPSTQGWKQVSLTKYFRFLPYCLPPLRHAKYVREAAVAKCKAQRCLFDLGGGHQAHHSTHNYSHLI